jgi:hypothetical protein
MRTLEQFKKGNKNHPLELRCVLDSVPVQVHRELPGREAVPPGSENRVPGIS